MILHPEQGLWLRACWPQVLEPALGMHTEAIEYLQLVCFDFLGNEPCAALRLTPPPPLKTHSQKKSAYYICDARQSHKHVQACMESKNRQCLASLYICAQMQTQLRCL